MTARRYLFISSEDEKSCVRRQIGQAKNREKSHVMTMLKFDCLKQVVQKNYSMSLIYSINNLIRPAVQFVQKTYGE